MPMTLYSSECGGKDGGRHLQTENLAQMLAAK